MVSTSPVTAARAASPARWAAALSRAVLHGITVRQDPITGTFSAPSSDGTTRYTVSWYGCSCQAAQGGDPVCLHRAAFREHCRAEDREVARQLRELLADSASNSTTLPEHLADLYVTRDHDGEPESSDLLEPLPLHKMCTDCLDTGWARMHLSGRLNDYTEVPCRCTAARVA